MNNRLGSEYSVDDADRLLDRLESAAHSETDHDRFWQLALEGLRTLTDCRSASLLLSLQGKWARVHCVPSTEHASSFQDVFHQNASRFPENADFLSLGPNQSLGVVPLNGATIDQGCILLEFQPAIAMEIWSKVRTIASALAEICWIRNQKRQMTLSGQSMLWLRWTTSQFAECKSVSALQRELVDSLVSLLHADRCSLVSMHGHASMLACSGVATVDARSPTVHAIVKVALDAIKHNSPIVAANDQDHRRQQPWTDDQPLLENRLVVPWSFDVNSNPVQVLVLEWLRKRDMLEHLQTASDMFPLLQSLWSQNQNWLQVPEGARQKAIYQTRSNQGPTTNNFWKYALGIAAVCVLGWLSLHSAPMHITADAHLEPVAMKSIHATADGFVDEILVEEEERVAQGQVLAKLRSPSLDFQIEDTLGKLRTMAEKRNGLNVSINQLANNTNDASSTQTKLTSELLILDTQEKHAQETLSFLRKEQERLSISSPIDGVVVASELRQELLRRPVKRGDALFRVANLDGDWRLLIQVADRDTQYVSKYYSNGRGSIDFIYDSLPAESFRAKVEHIAPSTENVLGSGSYQRIYASVERETAERAHMGATAHVTFHCGKQQAWFVWSRPLVEFVQRRTSLFSTSPNAKDNQSED